MQLLEVGGFTSEPQFRLRVIESIDDITANLALVDQLPELYKQLHRTTEEELTPYEAATNFGTRFILITRGEKLLAAATFVEVHMPSIGTFLLLDDVVVDTPFRQHGFGTQLILSVLDFAWPHGCSHVQVELFPHLTEANAFFVSIGIEFVQTGQAFGIYGKNTYKFFRPLEE